MILHLLVAFAFVTLSCQKSSVSERHIFHLIDKDDLKLGSVICSLPSEFDTTYRWLNTSDCVCCESIQYRSHSKDFRVVEEDGFLSKDRLDSGFYFTIYHATRIACDTQSLPAWFPTSSEIRILNIEGFIKSLSVRKKDIEPDVMLDTSRIINSHTYDIFYYNEIRGRNPFNILDASTEYNDRTISFKVQSNVHPRDSFYLIAMEIINSVKIE